MCKRIDYSSICVITNRKLCQGDFLAQMDSLCKNGIKAVILREKDLDESAYRELAILVIRICDQYGIPCILHTFFHVARELGIKEIHLPIDVLRTNNQFIQSHFSTIGVSIHSETEALEAEKLGATYITAGHIFRTDCKKGLEPRGLSFLTTICSQVKIPVYGIGGIHKENVSQVIEAGASGVCIMSDAMKGQI